MNKFVFVFLSFIFFSSIYAQNFFSLVDKDSTREFAEKYFTGMDGDDSTFFEEYKITKNYFYEIDINNTTNNYITFNSLFFTHQLVIDQRPSVYNISSMIEMCINDPHKTKLWKDFNYGQEIEIHKDFIISREYTSGTGPVKKTFYNIFTGEIIFSITSNLIEINFNDYTYYLGFLQDQIYNISYNSGEEYVYGSLIIATANNILQKLTLSEIISEEPRYYSPKIIYNTDTFILKENDPYLGEDSIGFQLNNYIIDEVPIFQSGDEKVKSIKVIDDQYLKNSKFEDINSITEKKLLRLLRNEIFARHGHSFSSDDLKMFFNTKNWYKNIKNKKVRSEEFSINEKEVFKKIIDREKVLK